MTPKAACLLRKIVLCPNASRIQAGNGFGCGCKTIVKSQRGESFQVPEPWRGEIENAPILFVSSNPSIGDNDLYPRRAVGALGLASDWPPGRVEAYFENRVFEQGSQPWIDGIRPLRADDTFAPPPRFWRSIRRRAEELLRKPPKPWVDFALTEVVHCKSTKEAGVETARTECVTKYLDKILRLSPARIVLVLGAQAKTGIETLLNAELGQVVRGSQPVVPIIVEKRLGGLQRVLVCLAHPSAHGNAVLPRKFSHADVDEILRRKAGLA